MYMWDLLWLFGCCLDAYSIRAIEIKMDMSLKKVYIKPIL
jgi:hypothetical protein